METAPASAIHFGWIETMEEPYKTLISELTSKGFFTTLMINIEVPRLVCATDRSASGLRGKSLWVSFFGNRWTIATWHPRYYLVPVDTEICQAVVDCLNGMDRCSAIPDELAKSLGLIECTEQEWKNLYSV